MIRLYPIIDLSPEERIDPLFVEEIVRLTNPAFIQVRQKGAGAASLAANVLMVRDIVRGLNSPTKVVVNDRPDVAARCGAPLVHVGDEDMSPPEIRRRYPDLQIGFSTHSLEDIERANGWDLAYIGFGPVFPTTTKRSGRSPVLDLCAEALRRSRYPVVFIGGITPERLALLPRSEKAHAAVISALRDFLALPKNFFRQTG